MKNCALALLLMAVSAAAQQSAPPNPPGVADASGRVAGRVFCSDTGKPARFASIQLMSEQSAQTPLIDPAALAASMGAGPAGAGPAGAGSTGAADDKNSSSDGKPADKGNVDFGSLLTKAMGAMMKGSSLTAVTAMDGSFSFDKVPPGTYYVITQLPGYLSPIGQISQKDRLKPDKAALDTVESMAQKIVVAPGSAMNLDIHLDRGATIAGTVRYDDGSPAPNVTPTLMLLDKDGKWKDMPPSTMLPVVTDDRGGYRFSGLPAGKYAVKAALPTSATSMGLGAGSISMHINPGDALVAYSGNTLWAKDVKPVELTSGDARSDVEVVFPIDGLHVVSGIVTAKSDGHAVNSGTVELQDPSDKTVKLRTTTIGKDGSFVFNYVPNGSYQLEVTSAADMEMEGAAAGEENNPLAMLLSGAKPKSFKEYSPTGMPLTLPGNSEGLTLQVAGAPADKASK